MITIGFTARYCKWISVGALLLSSIFSFTVYAKQEPSIYANQRPKGGIQLLTQQILFMDDGAGGISNDNRKKAREEKFSIIGSDALPRDVRQPMTRMINSPKTIELGMDQSIHVDHHAIEDLSGLKVSGPGAGVVVNEGSVKATEGTVIDMSGARAAFLGGYADGISLVASTGHSASALISGSKITADEAGVSVDCNGGTCESIVTQAHIRGGRTAILQAGGTLTVHGGEQTGTGSDPLDLPGTGSGLLVFSSDRKNLTTIDQRAVIKGTTGAGLQILGEPSLEVHQAAIVNIGSGAIVEGTNGIRVDQLAGKNDNTEKLATVSILDGHVKGLNGAAILVTGGLTDFAVGGHSTFISGSDELLKITSGAKVNFSLSNVAEPITGDIVNNAGAINISLDRTSLISKMTDVNSLSIGRYAMWELRGNSSVDAIRNAGIISLAHGAAIGNVLTIKRDYIGENGDLLFNAKIQGDKSAIGQLVVKGSASGTTNVAVTNIGGNGAKTVDGIEIIHVDGSSTNEAFRQKGRIVAGAYEYTLNQKGKSWYLDSNLVPAPNIARVVRPEAGSYIANMSATSMFQTTLHERSGEGRRLVSLGEISDGKTLWMRQEGKLNQFRDSSAQLRTKGNTYVTEFGNDLVRWSSNDQNLFQIGVMAGYGNSHSRTHSTISSQNSKGSTEGYNIGVYGSWYQDVTAQSGAYLDSQLTYNWFTNYVKGQALTAEKYNLKGAQASLEGGYKLELGQSGSANNQMHYFLAPQIQATWSGVSGGNFAESNGTHVNHHGGNMVQTRIGARAFLRESNLKNGTKNFFQPFLEANWLHNTKSYGVSMDEASVAQVGATNLGEVKLGLEGQLTESFQMWGGVGKQIGADNYSNITAMLGASYVF